MPRRRFFVPRDNIRGGSATLPSDQAHHLRDVLRLKSGDQVEIIDGAGAGYVGIVDITEREIFVRDLEVLSEIVSITPPVVLAAALIKADRFEWMLQKSTELGVQEILPLETRYCDIHIGSARIEGRLERWRRIVLEAAKQSRRLSVPDVGRPTTFADFMACDKYASHERLLLFERAACTWEDSAAEAKPTLVCVGPEGGWDETEVEAAAGAGFKVFNLGPRILRAETAALVAVTLVQFRTKAL